MRTSETDWKVAAREIWIFQLALRTPSANRGASAASTSPRSANNSEPGTRVK